MKLDLGAIDFRRALVVFTRNSGWAECPRSECFLGHI